MNIFVPILKVDSAKREVYGVMAEESPDKSNEIFDYASSKPYVKAWIEEFQRATDGKSFGNVRAQHSNIAAGKLVGVRFDDANKRIPVVARIVDDNEWKKVQEGVYTGFSIGGGYLKKWPDGMYTRYTAQPREVSIVDNPCMYGAKFALVKADGTFEHRNFAGGGSDLAVLRKQVTAQFEELSRAIDALLERRNRPARFVTNGVEKSDVAQAELAKALANGKPLAPTPGVRGGAATDTEATAWEELGKALDSPRRGFGNPFEGEDAGRPGFQPRASLTTVASGSATDAAGESSVRKRSKFEPR